MARWPTGTVIYCECPCDDEGLTNAKEWLNQQGYTPEQVRLVKRGGCVAAVWR